jgi:hypothetical protein
MVAPGAKGSFPSSTDDATKPKNIIALSKSPHENDWLPGNQNVHGRPPGRRAARDYRYYTAKGREPEISCCSMRDGKHADIIAVVIGDEARKHGVTVMVIAKERDVFKMNCRFYVMAKRV